MILLILSIFGLSVAALVDGAYGAFRGGVFIAFMLIMAWLTYQAWFDWINRK